MKEIPIWTPEEEKHGRITALSNALFAALDHATAILETAQPHEEAAAIDIITNIRMARAATHALNRMKAERPPMSAPPRTPQP